MRVLEVFNLELLMIPTGWTGFYSPNNGDRFILTEHGMLIAQTKEGFEMVKVDLKRITDLCSEKVRTSIPAKVSVEESFKISWGWDYVNNLSKGQVITLEEFVQEEKILVKLLLSEGNYIILSFEDLLNYFNEGKLKI